MKNQLLLNVDTIRQALEAILEPGQVTELRAFDWQKPGTRYIVNTVSGYFDYGNLELMAKEAARLTPNCSTVYFLPNVVNPALMARAHNRVREMRKGDASTSDADILRRRWLLIDCDAERPAGISASDEEHAAALEQAQTVRLSLSADGWPDPIVADSGNGGHLMYRIDLPADDGGLVERCLKALAARFNSDGVKVDTSVFNPARVWKLYGTLARKGDSLPDRPHRQARILSVPDAMNVVPRELLEALVGAEEPKARPAASPGTAGTFDIDGWISRYLPDAEGPESWQGGHKWIIPTCPFNPDHNRGEAFVVVRSDGAIGAGCQHESCKWGWKELRRMFEPDKPQKHCGIAGISTGFPLTDLGNAERLIAARGADLRHDMNSGKWLVWTGTLWQPDLTGEVERFAREVVRSLYDLLKVYEGKARDELYSHIRRSESAPRLSAMVELAKHCPDIPVQAKDLDADPWSLNVLNGTVDLKTGKLREHRREDLITKLVPVEYRPTASCPTWERFLSEVFSDDSELVSFVQRAAGYSLTGDTSEQCFFMLHGNGSNGKSTFLTAIRELLSDYHRKTGTDTLLDKEPAGPSNDIARLRGARFVSAVEAKPGRKLAEALVKELTGGDAITARFLNKEFFEFTPEFKLWLACNHLPNVDGQEHAIWRRIRLIPFKVQFQDADAPEGPYKDRLLPDKLKMEYTGILAWTVRGCLQWQAHGLGNAQAVKDATGKYRDDMDLLAEFFEECCVLHSETRAKSSVLYAAYVEWAKARGEKYPLSNRGFSQRLEERGQFSKYPAGGCKWWRGIGIVDDVDLVESNPLFLPMKEEHEQNRENGSTSSTSSTFEPEDEYEPGCEN